MVRINLENTVQVVLLEQGEGGVRARGGGGGGAGRGRGGGVRGGALVGQLPRARDARAGEAHARRGRARLQLCIILRRVSSDLSSISLSSNMEIEDVLRYLAGVPQPVPEAPVPGVPAPAAAPPLLLSTCHARQEVGKLTK